MSGAIAVVIRSKKGREYKLTCSYNGQLTISQDWRVYFGDDGVLQNWIGSTHDEKMPRIPFQNGILIIDQMSNTILTFGDIANPLKGGTDTFCCTCNYEEKFTAMWNSGRVKNVSKSNRFAEPVATSELDGMTGEQALEALHIKTYRGKKEREDENVFRWTLDLAPYKIEQYREERYKGSEKGYEEALQRMGELEFQLDDYERTSWKIFGGADGLKLVEWKEESNRKTGERDSRKWDKLKKYLDDERAKTLKHNYAAPQWAIGKMDAIDEIKAKIEELDAT